MFIQILDYVEANTKMFKEYYKQLSLLDIKTYMKQLLIVLAKDRV